MSYSLISIYAGGILSVLIVIFHMKFYSLFQWKLELNKVSGLNSRIFYTIHLGLLFLFINITAFTFYFAEDLSQSSGIGMGINLGLSVFWLWRSFWQVFYFSDFKNNFNYLLIAHFFLLSASYLIPVVLTLH